MVERLLGDLRFEGCTCSSAQVFLAKLGNLRPSKMVTATRLQKRRSQALSLADGQSWDVTICFVDFRVDPKPPMEKQPKH